MLIQPHAAPPFIHQFLSELVQVLIAMPSTMGQALSHARHMIMLLYSALTLAAAGMHPIPMDSFARFYSFWQLHSFSDRNNLISFLYPGSRDRTVHFHHHQFKIPAVPRLNRCFPHRITSTCSPLKCQFSFSWFWFSDRFIYVVLV